MRKNLPLEPEINNKVSLVDKLKNVVKKPSNTNEPEIVDEKTNVLDALKMMMSGSKENMGMSDDDVKDIENMKLIISAMLNDDLLESLTNLDDDELDDINDALLLNEYGDNPRLYNFIIHRLKLSRSRVSDKSFSNLLQIFNDISGKGMRTLTNFDDKSIMGNRFKR